MPEKKHKKGSVVLQITITGHINEDSRSYRGVADEVFFECSLATRRLEL
jgi:hypothetical protein